MLTKQNDTTRVFLNVVDGKIVLKGDDGSKQSFSDVTGTLQYIKSVDRTFNGENVKYWHITLSDHNTREEYVLSLPYSSGTFKSIVLSLSSLDEMSIKRPVKIHIYKKDGYNKAIVYQNDVRVDWVTPSLPEVKVVKVGDKEVKDDTERMKYISTLADTLNKRVSVLNM